MYVCTAVNIVSLAIQPGVMTFSNSTFSNNISIWWVIYADCYKIDFTLKSSFLKTIINILLKKNYKSLLYIGYIVTTKVAILWSHTENQIQCDNQYLQQ